VQKNRQTIYQYFKSKNLNADTINNILHAFGVDEYEIWPNTSKESREPNNNISTVKEKLSRNENLTEEIMQSRELINAQKKIIEMQEAEISRLKDEIRNLKGHSEPENMFKAKPGV